MRTLLCILAFALSGACHAQEFPSKPLKWIVPFPPGGSTDGFSRPLAGKLSEVLGQPVVVENVAGAGASIGTDRIAKSAPDGYTIGLATTGTHAINPHIYGAKLPHDTVKDFTHIALAVTSARRSPYVPEVPTMEESGVSGYNEAGSDLWFGVVGPAGIPKPIVQKLNAKLIEALRAPDMRERIRIQAFDLWTSTPEEFTKVVRADRAKWGKIVAAAGAKID